MIDVSTGFVNHSRHYIRPTTFQCFGRLSVTINSVLYNDCYISGESTKCLLHFK